MIEHLDKCTWMWAGLLTYRLCDRGYQCAGCPVDALFHPEGRPSDRLAQAGTSMRPERGLEAAPDRFHDDQHLWLRVLPEGRLQIGLDAMAARLLEPAKAIELPRVGTRLRRGVTAITVKFEGGEIRFASPVTGDLLRVHQVGPSRIHSILSSPYTRAWLLVMSVPRLERQLSRFSFGREVWFHLARDWARFQEACIGLAGRVQAAAPVLADGGDVDLDRLSSWSGSHYPALILPWIGISRVNPARIPVQSEEEGVKCVGGAKTPRSDGWTSDEKRRGKASSIPLG
jgi:glycine cleavage system H lipoate-binding protein